MSNLEFLLVLSVVWAAGKIFDYVVSDKKPKVKEHLALASEVATTVVRGIEQRALSGVFNGSKKEAALIGMHEILKRYGIKLPHNIIDMAVEKAVMEMNWSKPPG